MLSFDIKMPCSVLYPNSHLDGQIIRFSHRECMDGNLIFNSTLKPLPPLNGGIDDYFWNRMTVPCSVLRR